VFVDIPLGKALVPIEVKSNGANKCKRCFLRKRQRCLKDRLIECNPYVRKDGKNVMFKLVDLKIEEIANVD
jgi:hypothetical protein